MKSILRIAQAVIVLGLFAWSLQAADGILIVQKETSGSKVHTSQIQIEKNRIRVESGGATGERQSFVFDGQKQVMQMINYDKKSYSEMTKADIERLGGQMSDAMSTMKAQMEEAMKNIPPEQRARMEAMMSGRMGGMGAGAIPKAQKTEYRKVGTEKVGKWSCTKYEGYHGNEKSSEMYTVDPSALGFTIADFEIASQLGEFFKKLMPQNAERMFTVGKAEDQGFTGVPIKHVYNLGPNQTVSEVTDIRRESFAASTFEVPAGFKKEASAFSK